MLPSEAISEILRVINNPARTTEAFLWLKEALREVQGRGRWKWLISSAVRNASANLYLPLPTDCNELLDPVVWDSAGTATDAWVAPTTPWDWSQKMTLKNAENRYQVNQFGINFASDITVGSVWVDYYRNITMPASSSENKALDLPDQFCYRLAVYGAARHGLIGEDDYDRLNQAKEQFETALSEMRQWDARRGIANRVTGLQPVAINSMTVDGPIVPFNYSL